MSFHGRNFTTPLRRSSTTTWVTSLDDDLLAALQPHLADISPEKSESERKVHQKTALAFLYLFLSLGSPEFPGCMYILRSTIPIGADVGSSASIAEARLQLECVNRWAFVFEMCIHGNPSGVDNTCSTQGKGVVFQRPDHQKPSLVKSLWNFPELPLLLVNTKQAKSTTVELGKEEGYEKFETALGGDGVGVLWPAVLRNGLDEYEGGMEIDPEKFLGAGGNEGVEKLVGIHFGGAKRDGWKFWRVESY
ncbi:Mevalonate kinase [Colletotrichum graminicola]|nr:Mevalonate kinase [Colletotrichum graminicola]